MNTALNYQPEVLVDTADLSREEWLDYRRLGIGGSDAAAIMGLSPFATIRDLYFDKIGVTPVIEEEEENWVAKEVGHRLEDLVAMIFAKKTGLEVFLYEKCSGIRYIRLCWRMWITLSVSQMEALEFWNVRPAITMQKTNGQMMGFLKTMFCRFVIILQS